MTTDIRSSALRASLGGAIPLWIHTYKPMSWDDLKTEREEATKIIHDDKGEGFIEAVIAGGGKPGQAAAGFNAIAKAVAILSFSPGGITFFGDHWESKFDTN